MLTSMIVKRMRSSMKIEVTETTSDVLSRVEKYHEFF